VGTSTGVLLVNLGTPDEPRTAAVRRYLREFLADPRVLDINPVGRWLLLHLVILPTRPARSAAAYQKVWREDGSPLLVHSRALAQAVGERLSPRGLAVELAMRYGKPTISSALDRLKTSGCERLIIFPLYPQYASSSTGSTLEAIYRHVAREWNTPFISVVPPFYRHTAFLDAFAAVGRPVLDELEPDHVLFSFHGLPERQIRKSDLSGEHCLRDGCCDRIVEHNRSCYRAQCFATAKGLRDRLDVSEASSTICFQSRLGRTPWIQPFTDQVIVALAQRGVKRLAVFCPAFVADCLETLEEIGIAAAASFRAAGGDTLKLVPSLNSTSTWVDAVETMIHETLRDSD